KAERYLIFSNGYRGAAQNWDVTDGLVTTNDRFNYWPNSLENHFKTRLKPKETFFIDGSDRIGTSNHDNMAKFLISMRIVNHYTTQPNEYYYLNSTPNVDGFINRKNKGKLAAKAFL